MMYNRKLAPTTRTRHLVVLRRYLYYLDEQKLLAEAPAVLIRRSDFPRLPRLLPRALRADVDAQLCARLAAATDTRCRGLLLMRHTGLRVGELANLRLDCVREDNQGHHYLKVPLGKLNTERLVPLNDDALGIARTLQEHGRSAREWLIENRSTRRPYTTASYRNSISRVSSGLEKPDGLPITTHRLRHTFSTELLNAGLSLAAIRQLLGHHSMNMTLRYVTLTPNRLRQDYLSANTKARERYGKVPEAPRAAQLDDRTSAETIGDIVRQIKRDAATLSKEQKARARRAARQLKNLRILLDELGL
jgi:site-specific recombinase XerD